MTLELCVTLTLDNNADCRDMYVMSCLWFIGENMNATSVGYKVRQGRRKPLRRQSIGGASDCLWTMVCPSNALFAQNLRTPLRSGWHGYRGEVVACEHHTAELCRSWDVYEQLESPHSEGQWRDLSCENYYDWYRQLRARRALMLFKDVILKIRRALLLYTLYWNSALLVLKGKSSVEQC